MVQRCTNPNNPRWKDYGGRGIAICERWLRFPAFFADMGEPPPGLQIERKDNHGHYEPTNCIWADRKTQMRNRRNSKPPEPLKPKIGREAGLRLGAQVSAARRNAASKAACQPIKERWGLPSEMYGTEALIAETGLSRNTVEKHLGKRRDAQARVTRNLKRQQAKAAAAIAQETATP